MSERKQMTAAQLKEAYAAGERDFRDIQLLREGLTRPDLSGANLDGATLDGANLYGATLDGATLVRATLDGATLDGARVNWQSHNLIAEMLFRAAEGDLLKQSLALLIREHTEWCWERWLAKEIPDGDIQQAQWDLFVVEQREWALGIMAGYVQDGDDAPALLRRMARRQQPAPAAENISQTSTPDETQESAETPNEAQE